MAVKPGYRFRQAFAKLAVENVYKTKVLGTESVGLDRVNSENFQSRLDAECNLIADKIGSGKYKFTKFKEKLISKGASKYPRQLSIPTIRDRLTLRILCDYLFSIFPAAKPELPQDKITKLRNSIDSGKYTHFVKIDLQEFYPSIDHKLLIKKLRRKIRIPEFKNLIEAAITNPTVPESHTKQGESPKKGVAQGLSISNVLAEIFMLDVDESLRGMAPVCIRYVDDILLLTDSDPGVLLDSALKLLKKQKLNPHVPDVSGEKKSKTSFGKLSDGLSFLGYELKPHSVSVKENNVRGFEGSIVAIFAEYKYRLRACKTEAQRNIALQRFRWALNLKLTGCIYKNQRYGWIFYYSQINDLSVLRRIDKTVSSLYERFKIPNTPQPKRIFKAFYESKRREKSEHQYIVNYDSISQSKILKLLNDIGVATDDLSEVEVRTRFHKIIRKATRKLEKDITSVS